MSSSSSIPQFPILHLHLYIYKSFFDSYLLQNNIFEGFCYLLSHRRHKSISL
ncbi:hypothetical protein I3842_06G094300 [Carya illinoinensis]|uniref:Uncharacterized protein n=1 Tax=Carya illinoinensis TaxID=32201 RepID=A0A922ESE6_CARIL|nr:hypothetical protein I3842_06G094300 [Carya illinoinensis]